jgi:hypothetical protein
LFDYCLVKARVWDGRATQLDVWWSSEIAECHCLNFMLPCESQKLLLSVVWMHLNLENGRFDLTVL